MQYPEGLVVCRPRPVSHHLLSDKGPPFASPFLSVVVGLWLREIVMKILRLLVILQGVVGGLSWKRDGGDGAAGGVISNDSGNGGVGGNPNPHSSTTGNSFTKAEVLTMCRNLV